MRYAGIIKNDTSSGPGVCVSFFTQGCPFRCIGCQNPETWDFDGGKEFTDEVLDEVINSINANGILRPLCIMGGEPLCDENLQLVETLIYTVKEVYPDLDIYLWTGYEYDDLVNDDSVQYILENITCIIDGRFIIEKRDVTLPMRGSSNQTINYLT